MRLISFLIPYLVAGVMATSPTPSNPSTPPTDQESQRTPQKLRGVNRHVPLSNLRIMNLRRPVHFSQDSGVNGETGTINLPTSPGQPGKRATGPGGQFPPTTSGSGVDNYSGDQPNHYAGGSPAGSLPLRKSGTSLRSGGGSSGYGSDVDFGGQPNGHGGGSPGRLQARGKVVAEPGSGGGTSGSDTDDSDEKPSRKGRHGKLRKFTA
ncbi:hypothetical protein PgNI_11090 [Pyricularia grisea]|uniref:Uncharacterized protein n=1 Tax=Pyricularia grisea TaxID=148305 RepID=A0A6P8AYB6_PYRGI|nr:hypothetical protein PgNI_11090 [Pyricularia grisea]TLD07327.1 hypothetical protein PgNI_11090 [Pyricularia grisea]